MRRLCRTAATAACIIVGLFAVPAAASANHVTKTKSSATCTKLIIQFDAFGQQNKPVSWQVYVDGTLRRSGSFTFDGSSGTLTIKNYHTFTDAASHQVHFTATWPGKTSEDNGVFDATVSDCAPAPPPPPPHQPPPPPPVQDCDGNLLPPGSTPPTADECKPPPPRRLRCPGRGAYRLVTPNPSIVHGLVKFTVKRLRGPRIKSTAWFLRGKRLHDENSSTLDVTRRSLKIILWRQDLWTIPHIWGRYHGKVVIRTRVGGKRCEAVKRFTYFNHDPV